MIGTEITEEVLFNLLVLYSLVDCSDRLLAPALFRTPARGISTPLSPDIAVGLALAL